MGREVLFFLYFYEVGTFPKHSLGFPGVLGFSAPLPIVGINGFFPFPGFSICRPTFNLYWRALLGRRDCAFSLIIVPEKTLFYSPF